MFFEKNRKGSKDNRYKNLNTLHEVIVEEYKYLSCFLFFMKIDPSSQLFLLHGDSASLVPAPWGSSSELRENSTS